MDDEIAAIERKNHLGFDRTSKRKKEYWREMSV